MEGILSYLPGGSMLLSGGTRDLLPTSRKWQSPLGDLINPAKCPFCTKPQEELGLPDGSPVGWKRLPNPTTPHKRHSLIIPAGCWDAEILQKWGGEKTIGEALLIAALLNRHEERVLLVNVGMDAGQNTGHAHMHDFGVFTPPLSQELVLGYVNHPATKIFETSKWIVAAGGIRTGACLIASKNRTTFRDALPSLAEVLARIIALGNEKFISTEGLQPPYGFLVRVSADETISYASYCPVLHQWGITEYVLAAFEGMPWILPQRPETTATFLRG